ncbi:MULTISPECIES: hydroxymethylglutaryl-CoA lyase [unclassified Mesorhizobium]|uniref:hydroxymethylglutaryl-CoA lyase n=1 Tax=unclassified Mesorhizobium TaxID=325217 RepID=UPI0011277999|nr:MULTISPECIES: hydroxymethylglutaryl-CoA lyase [unclassified Mesorhizobium]TPL01498.1 hydroxymethylglutaryl-CoA lyase [Mesorhizobium sp. B2-4-16]TPL71228.1 hydroxymethylglutaryl-CoA lyase [Mesorhizobium sp. B2-4-3]
MSQSGNVTIVEVGPRDGLQNEKAVIRSQDKVALIGLLADAGLRRIEATAFVSPKWVPQMADHDQVMRGAPRRPGLVLSALVPNEKGAAAAIEAGVEELAVFASASETFARKNTNCTIAQSIERFGPVIALAAAHGLPVRGYVSCAIDCPYEGEIEPQAVRDVSERLIGIGCHEVAVSDTIGRASPGRIDRMLAEVTQGIAASRLACHFHDTSGQALANIDVALAFGVRVFDSAVGGLGGCPYAPGAAGNVATEAVVAHLAALGYDTGVDADKLEDARALALRLKAGTGLRD